MAHVKTAKAISDFIQKHQNRRLLDQINAAYDDAPDASETEQLRLMKANQHRLLEGQRQDSLKYLHLES